MSDLKTYNVGAQHIFTVNSQDKEIVIRPGNGEKLVIHGKVVDPNPDPEPEPENAEHSETARMLLNEKFLRHDFGELQQFATGWSNLQMIHLNRYPALQDYDGYLCVTGTNEYLIYNKNLELIQTIEAISTPNNPNTGYVYNTGQVNFRLYCCSDVFRLYRLDVNNEIDQFDAGTFEGKRIKLYSNSEHLLIMASDLDAGFTTLYTKKNTSPTYVRTDGPSYNVQSFGLSSKSISIIQGGTGTLLLYRYNPESDLHTILLTKNGSYEKTKCSEYFYVAKQVGSNDLEVYKGDKLVYTIGSPGTVHDFALYDRKLIIHREGVLSLYTLMDNEYFLDSSIGVKEGLGFVDIMENTVIFALAVSREVYKINLIPKKLEDYGTLQLSKVEYNRNTDKYFGKYAGDLTGNVTGNSTGLYNVLEYNRKKIKNIRLLFEADMAGVDVSINKYEAIDNKTPYIAVCNTPLLTTPGPTQLPGGVSIFNRDYNLIQTISPNISTVYASCDPERGFRSTLYGPTSNTLMFLTPRWNLAGTPSEGVQIKRYVFNPATNQFTTLSTITDFCNEFSVSRWLTMNHSDGRVYRRTALSTQSYALFTTLGNFGKEGDLSDAAICTISSVNNYFHMYRYSHSVPSVDFVRSVTNETFDMCVCSDDYYVAKSGNNLRVYSPEGTELYSIAQTGVRRLSLYKNKLVVVTGGGVYLHTLLKFNYFQDFYKPYGADWSLAAANNTEYEIVDNTDKIIVIGLPSRNKVFVFELEDETEGNKIVNQLQYDTVNNLYATNSNKLVTNGLSASSLEVSGNTVLKGTTTTTLNSTNVTATSLTTSGKITCKNIETTASTGESALKILNGLARFDHTSVAGYAGVHLGENVKIPSTTPPQVLPDNKVDFPYDYQLFLCSQETVTPLYIKTSNPITNTTAVLFSNGYETTCGSIVLNGSSTSYGTSSDYRLKKDIRQMDDGLNRILQCNPSYFKWINNDVEGSGFIAHELAEVFPEAVNFQKDDPQNFQSVDSSFLVPALCSAIQKLNEKIDLLTQRIEALENA